MYEFMMETGWSLLGLLGTFGLIAFVAHTAAKAIPKNDDPTKRSVVTIFGKPIDVTIGPVQGNVVGYHDVPYEMTAKMPPVKIETKSSPPTPMTIESMNFTLRVSKRNPVRFIESGGEKEVVQECMGMFTAGLQEFSANNTKFLDAASMKKAQPYLLAAVLNYVTKGDVVDVNDSACVKRVHDLMASKHGAIEIESLGVTLIQMDIGRIVEPDNVVRANEATAAQEKENERLLKVTEGIAERLKKLQEVDPTATSEMLQIWEGVRPADERKITVQGIGEADKLVGGLLAVGEAFARGQQPTAKKSGKKK